MTPSPREELQALRQQVELLSAKVDAYERIIMNAANQLAKQYTEYEAVIDKLSIRLYELESLQKQVNFYTSFLYNLPIWAKLLIFFGLLVYAPLIMIRILKL